MPLNKRNQNCRLDIGNETKVAKKKEGENPIGDTSVNRINIMRKKDYFLKIVYWNRKRKENEKEICENAKIK